MRKLASVVALVVALTGCLGIGIAYAAEGPAVQGTVATSDGRPVADAIISVAGPNDYTEVARTSGDGSFFVSLPEPGSYKLTIDGDGLPNGISVDGPLQRSVLVFGNSVSTTLFEIPTESLGDSGASAADGTPPWQRAIGLTADGLVLGLVIALGAVGLSLIFGTTGLTNFAHGELMTVGALATYFFNNHLELPFLPAAALAVVTCALAGTVQDRILWRPLRLRSTSLIAMLVISIGLGIALRYLFLFILTGWSFGGGTAQFAEYGGQAGIAFGPIVVTPKALLGSGAAVIILAATVIWLLKTQSGRASRAIADNPSLAAASGIDVQRVVGLVWFLGAGLAALGGVIYSLSNGVNWMQGYQLLLVIFASVTLGGLGTTFGAIVGSLIVGVLLQVSTLVIPSELKNVGVLVILIVVLLARPQGLLGRPERIG